MTRIGWSRSRWWPALAFTHRWLGIAGCLLFLLWFISGIAMIYVRMPELTAGERLAHAPALAADRIRIDPAAALAALGNANPSALELAMVGDRPVYRVGGPAPAVVFADSLERLEEVSPELAAAAAAAFAGDDPHRVRSAGVLDTPDQWTLQLRAHLPMHRISIGDGAGTEIYVSGRTGAVVLDTTRRERTWAYVGPVAHWLYVPVLRRNGPLWTQTILWTSGLGLVLCLSGLVAGVLRFSPARRYVIGRERTMTPYTGWMKWHHYAGLAFGLVTLTWTFSGLLSMGPFAPLSGPGLSAAQREAITGSASSLDGLSADAVRAAVRAAADELTVREMSVVAFGGRRYWLASEGPSQHRLVPMDTAGPPIERLSRADVEHAARAAAPGGVASLEWLDAYDEYYYDRESARPLPVLRAGFEDGTWIYLDPGRGALAMVMGRRDRLNRWLYHGLHSLDPAWLRTRRPAWDVVVILLSLGGIAGIATSLAPAFRRLRRHAVGGDRGRADPTPPLVTRRLTNARKMRTSADSVGEENTMSDADPRDATISRRGFLGGTSAVIGAVAAAQPGLAAQPVPGPPAAPRTLISLTVNGQNHRLEVEDRWTLADLLRDQLHLTGTKLGCERGECGACTVLVDGAPVYACSRLAVWTAGRTVLTVEGLASTGQLHPLQRAFAAHDAPQCGFCTSGQLMSAKALLDRNPHPTPLEVRTALAGNLCRCANYNRYVEAVVAVGEGRLAPTESRTGGVP